jgi:hypothetical protein
MPPHGEGRRPRALSLDDSKRAVYLDFEGSKNRAPTLCGLLYEGDETSDGNALLRQVILERAFDTCARRRRTAHVVGMATEEFLMYVVALARDEKRLIVSWSEHDLRKLREMCESLGARMEAALLARVHRNARLLAVRWMQRTHHTRLGRGNNSLANYLPYFGLSVPKQFGAGMVGEALRDLRARFNRGDTYGGLSARRRKLWRQVVRHNEFDCVVMREMVLTMVAGP